MKQLKQRIKQQNSYATPKQLRTIAKFCTILHIKTPLEERKMSEADAGRIVRELANKITVMRMQKK
jgi:hypothetical protein